MHWPVGYLVSLVTTCMDLVRSSLKKSLDDLGLQYLDAYLMHWPVGYLVRLVTTCMDLV